jgi:lipoprotein-anchoring transpeptidase ErfK/SrfK
MFRSWSCAVAVALAAAFGPAVVSEPLLARENVAYSGSESPGTIVVRTNERRLYYVYKQGQAYKYTVGVGRSGMQWIGTTSIASKRLKPAWAPPEDMLNGRKPFVIPSGAANNPMGAAALVLVDHDLAIHGTNRDESVGGFVSHGCIRMHNADVMDLFNQVQVGTRVVISH